MKQDLKALEQTEKDSLQEMKEDFAANVNRNATIAKFNKLTSEEKQLLLLYLHYGSYTYLAKRYNCSAQWLSKRIRKIKDKIK